MKPRTPFSEEVAERIYAGLERGFGLRLICRGPGMPTRATVMRWLRERPDFARAVSLCRLVGGLDGVGLPSGFDPHLGSEIAERLAYGQALRTVCREPAMPSRSTVHNWMRAHPRLAEDLAFARLLARQDVAEAKLAALGVRLPPLDRDPAR